MKKIICVIIMGLLIFSMAACTKDEPSKQPPNTQDKEPVTPSLSEPSQDQENVLPTVPDNENLTDTTPTDNAPLQPTDESDMDSMDIVRFMDKNLADIAELLGEESDSRVDEFDGSTVHSFGDIEISTTEEGKITGILLMRDTQVTEDKFKFKGMTFKNTNKEILDTAGQPINGSNFSFVYSDDMTKWLKIDFDENGQPVIVNMFYAADQGDRNFTWEEQ